ncbi:MAG: iron-sulfur cluster co-chaperone HscB C-terminal domain-containing protein [bacterium]
MTAAPGIPSNDPFALLGLPARFSLPAADVQRVYLEKVRALGGADDEPRAAALNTAKSRLMDPEQRALALLARIQPAPAAGAPPDSAADRALPEGFLMTMMETREQLDAAQQAGDRAAIDAWLTWAESQRAGHMSAVAELLSRCTFDPPTPASPLTLRILRTELNAWRYIERMIAQIADQDTA